MKGWISIIVLMSITYAHAQQKGLRHYGIQIGVMEPGRYNAITDVLGVSVGQVTIQKGDSVHTGVTAIIPHEGNIFQEKVPAAIYIGNGFGKLMGYSQVEELGNLETPIVLTNTLSVPTAASALIKYTLQLPGNEEVRSVNAVVGETNDGRLSDIRGFHVEEKHVFEAISQAGNRQVAQGNVGAGTGTSAFGYKGGMGTASRVLPKKLGGFSVGVLVQANFGGVLQIDGVPVGELLENYAFRGSIEDPNPDGSCMIIVATDAPVDARNLKRIAKRAMLGLAKTGGIASNGSGDYVIAFSTALDLRVPYNDGQSLLSHEVLANGKMSPLFMATIEATEEAILNALFTAETITTKYGTQKALPIDQVIPLMEEYGRIKKD